MNTRLLIILLALAPAFLRGEILTIQNDSLRVEYDTSTWKMSMTAVSTDTTKAPVALKNLVSSVSGSPVKSILQDPVFGAGEALICTDDRGESSKVELFHDLPFALVRVTLTNSTSPDEAGQMFPTREAPVAGFEPQLGVPWSGLVIRGTGGLHPAQDYAPRTRSWVQALWDKLMRRHLHVPAASYEWLALGDPATRQGIVAGFLTQDRATGVLAPVVSADGLHIQARSEFGKLLTRMEVHGGSPYESETLAVGCFDDVRVGLESYANALAREHGVHLPPQPAGFTTWYTEKNGGAADEKSLATLSDFIAKNLKPYGMNFVQIDDRWQSGEDTGNGPDKNFTDANPKGPYPSGMKAAADRIREDGLTPGLWFLPFSGAFNDPWFADKQGLFVKTKEGKPYDTAWAGTSLDMTNPEAQKYVEGIVTNITRNWGFSYLKIDGLFTGLAAQQVYVNSDYNGADGFGEAVFAHPDKTNIEAFRDGLKLVRAAAGPGVFLLGCNTAQNMRVFGGSMGLVDAMRIGPDNSRRVGSGEDGNVGPPQIEVTWTTWRDASPVFGSWEYFLNGRVWYDDPDPNYVRASLTRDEARTEASWTSLSGQLFTNSDWLPDLPPERLEILKRTIAPHGKLARPVDFLENDPPRVWQVIDDTPGARRDVVAFYNFDNAPQTIRVPLDRLDLPKAASYAAFDFWAGQFLPPVTEALSATLPPHGCQVLAVRPMEDHPFVLSTSRHVTQGMIDLADEKWDTATHTLSGTSRVVGGDPYEICMGAGNPQALRITNASVDAASAAAGIAISPGDGQAHDGGFRATIKASVDSIVSWSLVFKAN